MKKLIGLFALTSTVLAGQACATSSESELFESDRADTVQALDEAGSFEPYVVNKVTIPGSAANRKVDATICAPANDAGTGIADGAFPLVVISPGAKQSRDQYRSYCEHLASWGFVTISQSIIGNSNLFPPANHKQIADDIRSIITWALSAQSGLANHIDADSIGVAGHSMGGKASMLAAADDPRIGAVVGWDPVDANAPFTSPGSANYSSATPERMPDIQAAVAVLGETVNAVGSTFSPACAPASDNFQQYYEYAVTPALEVDIFNANHMQWTDSAACRPCNPCGSANRASVQRISRKVTVAWLRLHLAGDDSVESALSLDEEVSEGLVSVRSK